MSLVALSDDQLLCRVLGLHRRKLVAPLLPEGLIGFRWNGKWTEGCTPTAARVDAARELLRWLAGARVPLHPGADLAAVMHYLFIAHSTPGEDTVGLVLLDDEGRWHLDKVLFRGSFTGPEVGLAEVADLPLLLEAPEIFLFFLDGRADPRPAAVAKDFAAQVREMFAGVRPAVRVRALAAAGPAVWRFVDDPPEPPPPPPGGEIRWLREPGADKYCQVDADLYCRNPQAERECLAAIMAVEPPEHSAAACAVLLRACGGFSELARTPPDELRCPALPAACIEPAAALLELSRRLEKFEVKP